MCLEDSLGRQEQRKVQVSVVLWPQVLWSAGPRSSQAPMFSAGVPEERGPELPHGGPVSAEHGREQIWLPLPLLPAHH